MKQVPKAFANGHSDSIPQVTHTIKPPLRLDSILYVKVSREVSTLSRIGYTLDWGNMRAIKSSTNAEMKKRTAVSFECNRTQISISRQNTFFGTEYGQRVAVGNGSTVNSAPGPRYQRMAAADPASPAQITRANLLRSAAKNSGRIAIPDDSCRSISVAESGPHSTPFASLRDVPPR